MDGAARATRWLAPRHERRAGTDRRSSSEPFPRILQRSECCGSSQAFGASADVAIRRMIVPRRMRHQTGDGKAGERYGEREHRDGIGERLAMPQAPEPAIEFVGEDGELSSH